MLTGWAGPISSSLREVGRAPCPRSVATPRSWAEEAGDAARLRDRGDELPPAFAGRALEDIDRTTVAQKLGPRLVAAPLASALRVGRRRARRHPPPSGGHGDASEVETPSVAGGLSHARRSPTGPRASEPVGGGCAPGGVVGSFDRKWGLLNRQARQGRQEKHKNLGVLWRLGGSIIPAAWDKYPTTPGGPDGSAARRVTSAR